MLKAYADPNSGLVKGQFKRPSSGVDMSLDCSRLIIPSDTVKVDEEPWDIDN